jgi:hypothetical protein
LRKNIPKKLALMGLHPGYSFASEASLPGLYRMYRDKS